MAAIAKQTDRFSETDIDDEIVVMRLDTGEFFSLEATAATTWRLIDGTRDRATLVADLADQFGAAEDEIAADVGDFLRELRERGLIEAA